MAFRPPPQPSEGERTRRYRYVERALVEAAETARAAGLRPEGTLRAGQPVAGLTGGAGTPPRPDGGRSPQPQTSPTWETKAKPLPARQPREETVSLVVTRSGRRSPRSRALCTSTRREWGAQICFTGKDERCRTR